MIKVTNKNQKNICAAILAGGASKRIGKNKALIDLKWKKPH